MKNRKKGIYCLEIGEWFNSLKDKNSVEPLLQLLHDSPLAVPYIHRDIATESELKFYIKKWIQIRHKDYPILYLAFHGKPGCIFLSKENGRRKEFTADQLFDLLKEKCNGRVIHFGACSVLNIHGHTINKYLRDSKATAISGYANYVDWVDSAIFELLFLAELQKNQFTKSGIRAVKNRIGRTFAKQSQSLQFSIRIKK